MDERQIADVYIRHVISLWFENRSVIESRMQQSASNILVATQSPNIETQLNPQEFHHPLKFTVRHIFFSFHHMCFVLLHTELECCMCKGKWEIETSGPEIDILQTDFALFPRAPCMTLWLPKAFSERTSKISCQRSSLIEPNIAQFVLEPFGGVSCLFLFIFLGKPAIYVVTWCHKLSVRFIITHHRHHHCFNWYRWMSLK